MTDVFSKYIGIPYSKLHCWALVAKIYGEQFDIPLPLFEDIDPYHTLKVSKTICAARKSGEWVAVDVPTHGAVVLMQRARIPTHAGVFIEADTLQGILHTSEATGCIFTPLPHIQQQWNIEGFYMLNRYAKGW